MRMISDPEGSLTAVNLSGIALSEDEIDLLSRVLSFPPTPCHINTKETLDNLESYFRCLA